MLKKIGRWAAGRIQGSKGVRKYDDFMQRNPWVGVGLDVAGAVGTGMAGKALLGKVGGLKGLFSGGGAASSAATGAGSAVPSAGATLAKGANLANLFNPAASIDGGTLGKIGGFIQRNQGLLGGAAKAGAAIMGQQAQNAQQEEYQRLQEERFALEKEQDRREQERRERVARLLMPLFDQQARELNLPRNA